MAESGGIQRGTGADNLIWISAGQILELSGNNVAGVSDVDPNAIKASVCDALCKLLGLISGNKELSIAVARSSSYMTCGVNDNVATSKLLIAVIKLKNASRVWIKWHCVQQVVYLSLAEDLICVANVELGSKSLVKQGVCNVCAYVISADNTNFADESHSPPLLSRQNTVPVSLTVF